MDEAVVETIRQSLKEHLKEDSLAALSRGEGLRFEPAPYSCLNQVCIVSSEDGSQSCIVKLYLNHVKFLGPEEAIETERCRREYDASRHFRSVVPNCCPVIYFCDDSSSLVCMENLTSHRLWGETLQTSCDLHLGAKIADSLVSLHSQSHQTNMAAEEFSKLADSFRALPQQTNFLCHTHFVKPFREEHRKNKDLADAVRAKLDEVVQDEVVTRAKSLAHEWMSVGAGECCIHGDLHALSVMVKEEAGDVKFIDTECARIGPAAFDVALLVCYYVIMYHHHQDLSHREGGGASDNTDHAQLMTDTLDLICITLSRYMEGMSRALATKFDKHQTWRQILLYLGVEIIAWISGPPSVACVESLPDAQLNCLNTALRILHRQSLSLDTKGLSRLIHNQA
ncbi:uncharacterized protein LOC106012967 [Aplysia californica]|uniref:Uncharacterized protein LOC106012967 n=1 Tax=Aplysia californica TaxID=6500 RepID=A0ABM1A8K4_APLCA|nr:uncharacterized protein LOC106012967 [Aplysia californica]